MSIKKKLGMGVVSAALGISLIGGGTFAYFSDTTEQNYTFASGTIELNSQPEVNVLLDNIKPGDWAKKEFNLKNDGSLDIGKVTLDTEYVVKRNGLEIDDDELAEQYADSIIVKFLKNTGGNQDYEVIAEKSVLELSNMTPDELDKFLTEKNRNWSFIGGWRTTETEKVLKSGRTASFEVKFEFEYLNESQNHLQDLELDLNWTFEGYQTDGERVYFQDK